MRKNAALGFLFVVGVLIVWSAFIGHTGVILAALFCPQQIHLEGGRDQGDVPHPPDPGSPNPPDPTAPHPPDPGGRRAGTKPTPRRPPVGVH